MKIILLKKVQIAVFTAALIMAIFSCAYSESLLEHHDLYVEIHPSAQKLSATDIIRIRHNGDRKISLALGSAAKVQSVFLVSGSKLSAQSTVAPLKPDEFIAKKTLKYEFSQGKLTIYLPDALDDSTVLIGLDYEAIYDEKVPEQPASTEDPTYGVNAIISPKGTFLLDSAGWYPDIVGSFPSFSIQVTGPRGLEAVTAGKLINRETNDEVTTSVWEINQPFRGVSLSAGQYTIKQQKDDGLPIYTYFFESSQELAQVYLEASADYLKLYSDLIGPYPFPKFAVVENFFATGYGFPSYTLLGSSVIRLPFIVKTSLGHEVAHSWFGNSVYVDYRYGNWSEGLTTYIADYLYKERSSSEEAKEYREQILRDYAALVAPEEDFPLTAFVRRNSPATRAVGYGKAAMVFHMTRQLIGEQAFWKGLQTIYRENQFQAISWSEFAETFSRTGSMDLKTFFRQWVERPGAPVLALKDVTASETGGTWQVQGKLTQMKPYYTLKVPMRIESDNGSKDFLIDLSGAELDFKFDSPVPPKRLIVDPDTNLFRRLYPEELPATVNSIRGSQSLIALVSSDLPPDLHKVSIMLLQSLGRSDVPILRESTVTLSDLSNHDVLYLGLPHNKSLLPQFAEGLSVCQKQFTMDGVTYSEAGDSLFVVMPNPHRDEGSMAIFLPNSTQAAETAVRKIPHYGKYSVLIFRQGLNQFKKTWQALESPLIHNFKI